MISKEKVREHLNNIEMDMNVGAQFFIDLPQVRQYIEDLEAALPKDTEYREGYNAGWNGALQEIRAFCERRGLLGKLSSTIGNG